MAFVFAAEEASYTISSSGKVYGWGIHKFIRQEPTSKKSPTDNVVEIVAEPGREDTKFKRILGSNGKFALISFVDELFTFGIK